MRLALLGFLAPSAFKVSGIDSRRVCLTRLRCAYRLLLASWRLIPPEPRRPSFVPTTLMGFPLQRFPLSARREHLSASLPLLTFTGSPYGLARLQGLDRAESPFVQRPPLGGVAGVGPLLGFIPPGFSPLLPRHDRCRVSSHALSSRDPVSSR